MRKTSSPNFAGTTAWRTATAGRRTRSEERTALNRPRVISKIRMPVSGRSKSTSATHPYDSSNNYLLQPVTSGEGGYWKEFDWDQALEARGGNHRHGLQRRVRLCQNHHVLATNPHGGAKNQALQCKACHCEDGCIDWEMLGYPGDPIKWGSRERIREGDMSSAGTGAGQ